jgi:hypothetical protein
MIMIVVKFFSSFCSSENAMSVYSRILDIIDIPQYNTEIRYTTGEDYTHAVLLGVPMPALSIPKENVLGLAFEPPYFLGLTQQFIAYAQNYIGRYYIGEKGSLPDPFIEHHGFMWYCPFPNTIKPKDKLMSIIFSNKKQVFGHQYRHQLVAAILQSGLPIDIYGNGCNLLGCADNRIKGTFRDEEPYDGYRFSIAIENFSLPDYISEKLINPLMYECTPLYYGATNASKYFPFIPLIGNLVTDLHIIMEVINNPEKYEKKVDRMDILYRTSLLHHLALPPSEPAPSGPTSVPTVPKIPIRQVVLWGHKLHTHTHSYIHNGFYNAFKSLGYITYWFDDTDNVEGIDFDNTLFITEHQVNKKIPLNKSSLYLTHYMDVGDYKGVPRENIIILKVSPRDFSECDVGKDYTYLPLSYGTPMEYHACCDGYNCLYMYWATDLLPDEIDRNIERLERLEKFERLEKLERPEADAEISMELKDMINFIGQLTTPWKEFASICRCNGIDFNHYGAAFTLNSTRNKSIEENVVLIQESLLAPAIQDKHQIYTGYIPCRIFKNISYGKMGLTNSKQVSDLFHGKVIYEPNISELFARGMEFEKKEDKHLIVKDLMLFVKNNHTYLNRINTIKRYIADYTSFT